MMLICKTKTNKIKEYKIYKEKRQIVNSLNRCKLMSHNYKDKLSIWMSN